MENASKALLIAASVLIVILLIAFGMSIFNSTGDTSTDAQSAGNALSSATLSAKVKTILSMIDIEDDESFGNYLEKEFGGIQSEERIRELCEIVTQRTLLVSGNTYVWEKVHITTQTTSKVYYASGTIIYNLEEGKKYKILFEGANNNSIRVVEAN